MSTSQNIFLILVLFFEAGSHGMILTVLELAMLDQASLKLKEVNLPLPLE